MNLVFYRIYTPKKGNQKKTKNKKQKSEREKKWTNIPVQLWKLKNMLKTQELFRLPN